MRVNVKAVCAFAWMLSVASSAWAHGGFWRAHQILFTPDDPLRITLRSDVWGMALSDDGGESWRWICAEPFGRETTTPRRISMAAMPGGAVSAASLGDGLRLLEDDPCQWREASELADTLVRGVVQAGDTTLVLTGRSDAGTTTTLLFASDDGGDSFGELATALPAGFVGTHLAVAPGDPQRLYATAASGETLQLARSEDGGDSWSLHTHVIAVGDGQWEARVLAVNPQDPDMLLVVADGFEPRGGQLSPDTVYLSTDGGAGLSMVFGGQGDVPAAAFSPDGTEVLIGGIVDGLLGADSGALASDGSSALERRHDSGIYGLTWTEDALYAGTEEFAEGGTGYSVGRSVDGGRSFERLMSVCDVTAVECDPETHGGLVCPALWSDMGMGGGGFKEDFLETGRCGDGDAGAAADAGAGPGADAGGGGVADAPEDAGGPAEPTAADGGEATPGPDATAGEDGDDGCSCAVRGSATPLRNGLPVLISGLWLWARRRRTAPRDATDGHGAKAPHT